MVRNFIAVVVALALAALVAGAAFLALGQQCSGDGSFPNPFGRAAPSAPRPQAAQPKPPIASFELQLRDSDRMEGRVIAGSAVETKGEWARRFLCDIKIGEFAIALFALFLTVFAGLLWGVTHRLTRATRDIAAAQQRDTEIMQRAYLSAVPAGVSPFNASAHADGHVEFRNLGHVPARKVKWFIDVATSSDMHRAHFPIGALAGNNVVPANADMKQSGRAAISPQEFENFQSNSICLYVWGTVQYDDGFGNERHTNFCHRYDARGFSSAVPGLPQAEAMQLGRAAISAEGMTYHRYGNDAD